MYAHINIPTELQDDLLLLIKKYEQAFSIHDKRYTSPQVIKVTIELDNGQVIPMYDKDNATVQLQ